MDALKASYNDIYPSIDPKNFVNTLKGKVALITGSGRGIGRATALAFAQAGADVAVLSRTKSELDETARLCEKEGVKTLVLPVDAMDSAAVEAAVKKIETTLGPIDILVNNAGANRLRPFKMFKFSDWWDIIDINLKAPMQLVSLVLPSMLERNSGVIINVASRAAIASRGMSTPYTTSKTALVRATACLQAEIDGDGKAVHCYSLHPGGPRTQMNDNLVDEDVDQAYPGMKANVANFVAIQKDTVQLCAYTCVFLAADARAEGIKGRYIDVEQDIAAVSEASEEIVAKNLHDLKLDLVGDWQPDQLMPKRL